MTFDDLSAVYNEWLDLREDPDLLRLMFGGVIANRFDGLPVWMMMIMPSGGGKSELLMSLSGAETIVAVSSLTPAALASGYGTENSLLFRLDGKVLVIKDMSSTTSVKADDRMLLFSWLRDAYDGELNRSTGKMTINWKGKFGMMVGATLAIEQSRTTESMLGERFMYVRPRMRIKTEEQLNAVLKNGARKTEMKALLRDAAGKFLDTYQTPSMEAQRDKLPKSVIDIAKKAAVALVSARSSVSRSERERFVDFPVELTEMPTRLMEQFMLVGMAMQSIGAGEDELIRTMKRFLLDSIPYIRMVVIDALVGGVERVTDIANRINMSDSYTRRVCEDLHRLGVLDCTANGASYKLKLEILSSASRRSVS